MSSIKICIIILFLSAAARGQHEPNPAGCRPLLKIKTDLSKSLIFLNGNPAARGKLDSSVEMGSYIITVKENPEGWNSKIFTDTLTAAECRTYYFNYAFKNQVYLRTEPADAYVYVGDSLFGHTPLFIEPSVFDGNTVELRKPGYRDKFISLNDIENNSLLKLNYTGKINEKSFFERDIFKYMVGSIVVLGGITAYFKLRADKEFDSYQITGSSTSLRNTRRYDLISGISFAALQINFGVLIYYFLID